MTDVVTLCDQGYRLYAFECVGKDQLIVENRKYLQFCASNCVLSIPSSSLPADIVTAVNSLAFGVTMWIHYNQVSLSSSQILFQVID